MLLSLIYVDPDTYQKRDEPYSVKTVEAIVKEGIKLSKFDALPLLPADPDGRHCVAGDGHSRFEAICRLREKLKLPAEWRRGADYDVPHKIVEDLDEAMRLAWTANFSKRTFTAVEEAKVFKEMVDEGYEPERVATLCHVKPEYVRDALPLNCLCRDIRVMVGAPADAGGIEPFVAKTLAGRFERFRIGTQQQQELWHKVLKHADLTQGFVRSLLDKIGRDLAGSQTQGALFEIPASVGAVVREMRGRAENARRLERGLAWIMQCRKEAPALLGDLPKLKALLDVEGADMLKRAKQLTDDDAAVVGALVTDPKARAALAEAIG